VPILNKTERKSNMSNDVFDNLLRRATKTIESSPCLASIILLAAIVFGLLMALGALGQTINNFITYGVFVQDKERAVAIGASNFVEKDYVGVVTRDTPHEYYYYDDLLDIDLVPELGGRPGLGLKFTRL